MQNISFRQQLRHRYYPDDLNIHQYNLDYWIILDDRLYMLLRIFVAFLSGILKFQIKTLRSFVCVFNLYLILIL